MTTIIQSNDLTLDIEDDESRLLHQLVSLIPQSTEEEAQALWHAFTETALNGTMTWDNAVVKSIETAIATIDTYLCAQLNEIIHQPDFLALEGRWRGLAYLVNRTNTGEHLRIKMLNVSKAQLAKALDKAVEFDQSHLFKHIYEQEFGSPGGEPFGVMLGDYTFSAHVQDMTMLEHITKIAAAAFCPFITSADPHLFGFDDWQALSKPRDLAKVFDSQAYAKWHRLRESDDARFITLTLPRALARLPYGQATVPVNGFCYEETSPHDPNQSRQMPHEHYCWMNAAYLLGERITNAHNKHAWSTAIRGAEGGGKVSGLPLHTFRRKQGDIAAQCPTEVGIADRREAELSKLGFLPLCHYKGTDYAVFFGAQSIQKPKRYDRADATANAAISARLPYILATSRFAHYLKVMARDKMGAFMEVSDCEQWLNRWILNYVNGNANSQQDIKAKYPLAEAKIIVEPIPGQPGAYHAVAWLRPWLQLEALTASLRLVATIPKLGCK